MNSAQHECAVTASVSLVAESVCSFRVSRTHGAEAAGSLCCSFRSKIKELEILLEKKKTLIISL